jgi:hypothetical protein
MLDPTLTLALAMQSDPGVYALLVGSGLSRSAGIPTGWEVVLDLIRKVALLLNENCEPEPDEWYRNKFREEPDYSHLIDELAKTPAERQQLLRYYFEPSETEFDELTKTPTQAHHAIAALVKRGHVKVIVTTNFDRLLEKALESANVAPTVISSTDHILGSRPLAHCACTVVKINGDYLDTRIKNTPAELANYDEHVNRLLDQIFDEYGLLVVGWSGVWDTALAAAIERSPNHRFTTFWAAKGECDEQAERLISRRRATVLRIDGADELFQGLAEKIAALEEIKGRHPLSASVAVSTLKRYLSEERYRIRARDLVFEETKKLIEECDPERFPAESQKATYDEIIARMKEYEALTETLLALFIAGAYWGESLYESIWSDCLSVVADRKRVLGGITAYVNLQDYPALLLAYGGGIASLAGNKYGNVAAILLRTTRQNISLQRDEPLAVAIDGYDVIDLKAAQKVINPGRTNYTPANDYLHRVLREPLRDLLPRDPMFEKFFNRFEYLWALIRIDLQSHLKYSSSGRFVGRFLWSDRKLYDYKETELRAVYEEMDQQGEDWPGLKAGLFDGSLERLAQARQRFDETREPLRQGLGIH